MVINLQVMTNWIGQKRQMPVKINERENERAEKYYVVITVYQAGRAPQQKFTSMWLVMILWMTVVVAKYLAI